MNNNLKAHLALLAANVIYAANFSIAKEVMPQYVLPFAFILLRVSGALVLYWLVSALFVKEKIDKKDLPRLFLCGVFGISINQLLFFKGLNITSPINAAIMMVCSPIIVAIASAVAIKEKFTQKKIAGIIIGLSGALMLIWFGAASNSNKTSSLTGDIYVLINATSWAIYLVLVKPLMHKYNTFTVIKWAFLFGFLIVLPFGYPELSYTHWQELSSTTIYQILFVVIATTFFAYLFNTYALKQLNASVVSIYIYLQPLLASLIAVSLKKDELDLIKIVSIILIFTGVYWVSKPEVKKN